MLQAPKHQTDRTFETAEVSPHIGTEIRGVDLSKPLSPTAVAELRKIWVDRALLLFRAQSLTQDSLVRFSSYFGQLGERTASTNTAYAKAHIRPEIMLISNVRENGETIGALPDGELQFHHDMIQTDLPHMASCLYAIEVPTYGGETCFAAGHAAYDTLPSGLKSQLEGKRAHHLYRYGTTKRGDEAGATKYLDQSVHPAVRTHDETGRKAIYLNRLMSVKIEGLDEEQSDKILQQVFEHAEKPEFVYCHQWKVGDLLIWDNRNSMHARKDFPSDQRRIMWRTQILGTHKPQ